MTKSSEGLAVAFAVLNYYLGTKPKGSFESNDSLLKWKASWRCLQWIIQESGIRMDVSERFFGVATVNSSAAGSIVKEVRDRSLRMLG
ncbi:hypothetical protein TNCT_31901 [Trichonephila clavata]|uniref:Uncharacterized protein n=1 Tax=Trichonephila clavata TaxID=2740835 RepID=A0A8X6HD20_TRICU|nr:hypothetical protein TNCT_31901 [Trichonephila clavata]